MSCLWVQEIVRWQAISRNLPKSISDFLTDRERRRAAIFTHFHTEIGTLICRRNVGERWYLLIFVQNVVRKLDHFGQAILLEEWQVVPAMICNPLSGQKTFQEYYNRSCLCHSLKCDGTRWTVLSPSHLNHVRSESFYVQQTDLQNRKQNKRHMLSAFDRRTKYFGGFFAVGPSAAGWWCKETTVVYFSAWEGVWTIFWRSTQWFRMIGINTW